MSDEQTLLTPNYSQVAPSAGLADYLERPMSLPVKLCEHLAQDCLQAVEGTKDPQTRELLLRHALEWMQDALAALKQSRAARRTRPS
jgi:hypothetical protein